MAVEPRVLRTQVAKTLLRDADGTLVRKHRAQLRASQGLVTHSQRDASINKLRQ